MSIDKYLKGIESFKDKRILITGCTAGIGLKLLEILLSKEAHVVMLIRNIVKANKIKERYPDAQIDIVQYDQSDYELIDSAIKEIKEKHSDFYALVANAGILFPPKNTISKQGYPLTIDTNFLGLKYFLDNLTPSFKNKRYILQGSLAAGLKIKKDWDLKDSKLALFDQYNLSKAGVEALWHHYYINDKDNEYILTEPGVTSTDILRNFKEPIKTMGKVFVKTVSHSPKKASLTLLKALTKDTHNGDYIVPRGMYAIAGFPIYKRFPKKRIREYLIKNENN